MSRPDSGARLDSGQRQTLLDIARRAIAQGVAKREPLEVEVPAGALGERLSLEFGRAEFRHDHIDVAARQAGQDERLFAMN